MAIDTRDRRSSALLVGMPFRPNLSEPNAAMTDSERAQVAYLYRGFDYAGDDGSGVSTSDWYIMAMRRGTR